MMRPVWFLMVLSLVSAHISAQKLVTSEQLESVMNPRMLEDAERILRFDSLTCDMGILSEDGGSETYTFRCRNVSSSRIVLTRIRTSCGCAKAVADKPVLEPGDETGISVAFTPFGHPGKQLLKVFVYTQLSENEPPGVLTLVGEVTPSAKLWKDYRYAMGALRIRGRTVDFGKVRRGMKRRVRIACANSGSRPLRVKEKKGFVPEYLSVHTEPELLQSSEEGYLIVEIDGSGFPDMESGRKLSLSVLLDGLFARPSDCRLGVSFELE